MARPRHEADDPARGMVWGVIFGLVLWALILALWWATS